MRNQSKWIQVYESTSNGRLVIKREADDKFVVDLETENTNPYISKTPATVTTLGTTTTFSEATKIADAWLLDAKKLN